MLQILLWRILAMALDTVVGIALCVLLSTTVGRWISSRAALALRIGEPETLWSGAWPMMISVYGSFFFCLPLALLLVHLNEPITGVSVGRIPLPVRVVAGDGSTARPGQLWVRTLVKTAPLGAIVLALLSGTWSWVIVSMGVVAAGVVGLALGLGPSGRPLHDRLAGTRLSLLVEDTREVAS